jgi:hypothetical protein
LTSLRKWRHMRHEVTDELPCQECCLIKLRGGCYVTHLSRPWSIQTQLKSLLPFSKPATSEITKLCRRVQSVNWQRWIGTGPYYYYPSTYGIHLVSLRFQHKALLQAQDNGEIRAGRVVERASDKCHFRPDRLAGWTRARKWFLSLATTQSSSCAIQLDNWRARSIETTRTSGLRTVAVFLHRN